MRGKKPAEEMNNRAMFLHGFSAALSFAGADHHDVSDKLKQASKDLERFSKLICGQGYVCNGGPECGSSHK